MGSIGLPEDVCVLSASTKERMLSSINSMLVGVAVDGVEACTVNEGNDRPAHYSECFNHE